MRQVLLVTALVTLTSCVTAAQDVRLNLVAGGFQRPLDIQNARDGSERLFVVEQAGLIRILKGGQVLAQPFLDVRSLTRAGGERGLLGLAFDPNFKSNRRFYVNYTDVNGTSIIARYTATGDRADANSATVLLRVEQPYANHNGGGLAFGPDGMLYAGLGDGGSGGDPQNNGQKLDTLLGKLLRLDVRGDRVAVPQDNPFANRSGARPEIWAYGLRNPWRFSFDRETGDLFIADVGQNRLEEINFQPRSSKGGENYGWRLKEATDCFQPRANCDREGLTDPIVQYDHAQGVSVTGGYVYRGKNVASLAGRYVYGDFGTGVIWAASRGENGRWTAARLLDTNYSISAFGQDEDGELYLADYGSGNLYRFANR